MSEQQEAIYRLQQLCNEPETANNGTKKQPENKAATKERLKCWIAGILISFASILVLFFVRLSILENKMKVLIDTLSDTEIMFMSVSTAITAMYDYVSTKKMFSWFYLIVVLIGSLFFMGFSVINEIATVDVNPKITIIINISFFLIVFLRGVVQYLCEFIKGN